MRLAAALVAVAVGGCFQPHPPAGSACAASLECPTSLICTGGLCVEPTGGPEDGCFCAASTLTCPAGTTTCAAGCDPESAARCLDVVPSNGIPADTTTGLATAIVWAGPTTIDTDTGAITGSFTRTDGLGTLADINYSQAAPMSAGGAPLGVFAMSGLTISGDVILVGMRAAVFVVATDVVVSGTLVGDTGCNVADPTCPGPGGSSGTAFGGFVVGCNGGTGLTDLSHFADSGGGGGGGGKLGGAGGLETLMVVLQGGTAGPACIPSTLEPLVGGGGGGAGGPGVAPVPAVGGGGGGAVQITAFGSISVTGTIAMNGGGGSGGPPDPAGNNAGAGAGGGAGGAILLEAPTVSVTGALAANGGGGGGGGADAIAGTSGGNGAPKMLAAGGAPAGAASGRGGDGGIAMTAAKVGGPDVNTGNSGGGGGAVGVVYLRAIGTPRVQGANISPPAGTGPLVTQ